MRDDIRSAVIYFLLVFLMLVAKNYLFLLPIPDIVGAFSSYLSGGITVALGALLFKYFLPNAYTFRMLLFSTLLLAIIILIHYLLPTFTMTLEETQQASSEIIEVSAMFFLISFFVFEKVNIKQAKKKRK